MIAVVAPALPPVPPMPPGRRCAVPASRCCTVPKCGHPQSPRHADVLPFCIQHIEALDPTTRYMIAECHKHAHSVGGFRAYYAALTEARENLRDGQ